MNRDIGYMLHQNRCSELQEWLPLKSSVLSPCGLSWWSECQVLREKLLPEVLLPRYTNDCILLQVWHEQVYMTAKQVSLLWKWVVRHFDGFRRNLEIDLCNDHLCWETICQSRINNVIIFGELKSRKSEIKWFDRQKRVILNLGEISKRIIISNRDSYTN